MELIKENINAVKKHLEIISNVVGKQYDNLFESLELDGGEEEILFDIDPAECHFEINYLMNKTKNIDTFSYDECSARCGLFSQYNLDIDRYFEGMDVPFLKDKFIGDGIKISFIENPLLIGLRNIKEDMYDSDCWSPFAGYVALEIEYDNNDCMLSIDDESKIINRVLFYVNAKYETTFNITKMLDHNPVDDVYTDDENIKEESVKINDLPKYSPMLKMFIDARKIKEPSLQFLLFYKILEYISPVIARKQIYERLNQKLDKISKKDRSSTDLDSLIELTRVYDNSMRDGDLAKIVLDECADLVDLQDYIPNELKKKMIYDSKIGKNCRWTYENIKDFQNPMKLCLAKYLYSTRNSIVHAKSNYEPTGYECPDKYISNMNELLQSLCETIIFWKDRH